MNISEFNFLMDLPPIPSHDIKEMILQDLRLDFGEGADWGGGIIVVLECRKCCRRRWELSTFNLKWVERK